MTEVGFYHLTRSTVDRALPRLLEKAYAAGQRVLVRGSDPERLELLNRTLWTYGKDSFLPHGAKSDGFAEQQPIYLTTGAENPNEAVILVLVDGAEAPDLARYSRCLELFDGGNPDAVDAARKRWRDALGEGHGVVYWQETDRGGWSKAAERAPRD
ncbi:MAG: DNA polymerase III subunit chi [Geminicoccaceae bacterium]